MSIKRKDKINEYTAFGVIGILIVTVLCFCFSKGISGNDFWWHIKVGEYIVENKTVPTTDIFSWYGVEHGIEWTAHEWLSDVIFFVIYNSTGEVGIYIFSTSLAAIMLAFIYRQCKEQIKNNILFGVLYIALFAVVESLFFYGRPQIFSYLLLFFELKLLYDFYEKRSENNIFLIPVIGVLWSNLHGGSSNLCYLLCILVLLVALINWNYGRIEANRMPQRQLVKLSVVTLLSIVAIFINPIGQKVFLYPYISFGDTVSMMVISEWQSPDAKETGNLLLYFLPILLMTIGIIIEHRKVRLLDLLIMLFFLFLFFRSSRFIILWYIAASFYAFRYLPVWKTKISNSKSSLVALIMSGIIFCIPIGMSIINLKTTISNGNLISTVMEQKAIDYIKEDAPKRIFNDYNLGEALIANNIPVFFDARADLYAKDDIMADGISLMSLKQVNENARNKYVDVFELISEYEFDSIVILKSRPLYSYIISHPNQFEEAYSDDSIAYFKIKYD